jgi:polyisoprenoid-binding protein YceI
MRVKAVVWACWLAVATAIPAWAETWTLDPNHTRASFSARHMMVTTVRGDFHTITGTVEYDGKDVTKAVINVTIDTRTLDTKLEARDTQLKDPDLLIEPPQGGVFVGDEITITMDVQMRNPAR